MVPSGHKLGNGHEPRDRLVLRRLPTVRSVFFMNGSLAW